MTFYRPPPATQPSYLSVTLDTLRLVKGQERSDVRKRSSDFYKYLKRRPSVQTVCFTNIPRSTQNRLFLFLATIALLKRALLAVTNIEPTQDGSPLYSARFT